MVEAVVGLRRVVRCKLYVISLSPNFEVFLLVSIFSRKGANFCPKGNSLILI